MSDWYYGKENTQHGPVSDLEIRNLISTGEITEKTVIWREGMTDWLPLNEVQELQASSGVTPADPVAQNTDTPYVSPQTDSARPPHGMSIPTDGLATASLVCGILSVTLCGLFAGIPAVICGHKSLAKINSSPTPIQGKGMAIAGLVTGYLSLVISLLFIVFFVIGLGTAGASGAEF